MTLISQLNHSKYNEVVFKNKVIDKKLKELTQEEKFYTKVYIKNSKLETVNFEKFEKEKKSLNNKLEKIRKGISETKKLDENYDKNIYNRQLTFLQLERIYRDLCLENKIYEPLDIKNMSEEADYDFNKILSRNEVEKKIQKDSKKKIGLIQEINKLVKNQTEEFRRVDQELLQDFEKIKNCEYHFSKHDKKFKKHSRTVSSSLEQLQIKRIFNKAENKKRKRELLRLKNSSSFKLSNMGYPQSNRTPNKNSLVFQKESSKIYSTRHKKGKSHDLGLLDFKLKEKKEGKNEKRGNISPVKNLSKNKFFEKKNEERKKEPFNIEFKIIKSKRKRRDGSQRSINRIRKKESKTKDISIPSFEIFSKQSQEDEITKHEDNSIKFHDKGKSKKEVLNENSISKTPKKIKKSPIKVTDISSKGLKSGKKVTIPGITIIPPSKRGSIWKNEIASLSSIDQNNEDNYTDEKNKVEFDLNKLMQKIKKEEQPEEESIRNSILDKSYTSLEDSILKSSKFSSKRTINRKRSENPKSEPNVFKLNEEKGFTNKSKKSSLFAQDKPLIVIRESTNEFSTSKISPQSGRINKANISPTSSQLKKRTMPTLPLLSVNESSSEDSEKKEFNRRISVRIKNEKKKKKKILDSEVSPSKQFLTKENDSSDGYQDLKEVKEPGKFEEKLNQLQKQTTKNHYEIKSEQIIEDFNTKNSLNKPKSVLKKNSMYYTPKHLSSLTGNSSQNRPNLKRNSVRFSESSFKLSQSEKKKKAPTINSIFKEDGDMSKGTSSRSQDKKTKNKSHFFNNRKDSNSQKSNTFLSPETTKKYSEMSVRSQPFERDFECDDQDFYHPREYQGNPNQRILTKVTKKN